MQNRDLPEVKAQAALMTQIHEEMFEKCQITFPGYKDEVTKLMDEELFVTLYEDLWGALRHDYYAALKAQYPLENSEDLTRIPTHAQQLTWNKIFNKFEKVRTEIFNGRIGESPTDYDQPRTKELM